MIQLMAVRGGLEAITHSMWHVMEEGRRISSSYNLTS